MSRAGHTLVELMVSLGLICVLAGIAAALVSDARDEDRIAQAYANDLRHVRQASDLVGAAVRGAAHVEFDGTTLVTDGTRWSVGEAGLLRDGRTVAAGVAGLHASSSPGRVWTVAISPAPRREGAHPPALATRVRQRVEAAR